MVNIELPIQKLCSMLMPIKIPTPINKFCQDASMLIALPQSYKPLIKKKVVAFSKSVKVYICSSCKPARAFGKVRFRIKKIKLSWDGGVKRVGL